MNSSADIYQPLYIYKTISIRGIESFDIPIEIKADFTKIPEEKHQLAIEIIKRIYAGNGANLKVKYSLFDKIKKFLKGKYN